MSKILKSNSTKKIDTYDVAQFAAAERGRKDFVLSHFSADELSVQEKAETTQNDPNPQKKYFSAPSSYADSRPSAPRLFAAYEDDGPSYAPPQATEAPARPRLFAAYEDDGPSYAPSNNPDINKSADGFQEMPLANVSLDDLKLLESQKMVAEQNAAKVAVENELTSVKNQLTQAISEKETVQLQLKEVRDGLEKEREKIRQEGYEKARAEFEEKEQKRYNAERADYMTSVSKSWNEAVAEIKKIDDTLKTVDKEMPEIVVAYVREIIGAERKLNDRLITNVIQGALSRLKDLQQIVFTVNPDDAAAVSEKFPQHGIAIDANIPKGSVKTRTKIGDIDLSIDKWVENLEKQINEQLAISQNNNAP
ncbi:MAG: hypothetical protein LBH05_05725 [Deferribacteraceae bacterium]|jgi:flagellar biosynthesis/type III secretory pathway protein FliH|nr:hypothetical protein [Deferribacteraceae bacterium]